VDGMSHAERLAQQVHAFPPRAVRLDSTPSEWHSGCPEAALG
jgi:hypothetical protein